MSLKTGRSLLRMPTSWIGGGRGIAVAAALLSVTAFSPAPVFGGSGDTIALIIRGDKETRPDVVQGIALLLEEMVPEIYDRSRANLAKAVADGSPEELEQKVDEALALIGSSPAEGQARLQACFFEARKILGLVPARLLSRIYLGMALGQIMADPALTREFVLTARNLNPDLGPDSSLPQALNQLLEEPLPEARFDLVLTVKPMGARVFVDGQDLGVDPMEAQVGPGSHLVQISAEGYLEQGWMKDPQVHGPSWNLEVDVNPAEARLEAAVAKVTEALNPTDSERKALLKSSSSQAETRECPGDGMQIIRDLHEADAAMVLLVSSLEDRILIRGCFEDSRGVSPISILEARRSSLRDKVRSRLIQARKQAREEVARPTLTLDELNSRLDKLQQELEAAQKETEALLQLLGGSSGEAGEVASSVGKRLDSLLSDFQVARGSLAQNPQALTSLLKTMEKSTSGVLADLDQVKSRKDVAARLKKAGLERFEKDLSEAAACLDRAEIALKVRQAGPEAAALTEELSDLRKKLRGLEKLRRKAKEGALVQATELLAGARDLESRCTRVEEKSPDLPSDPESSSQENR